MAAFVAPTATPLSSASSSSRFVTGTNPLSNDRPPALPATARRAANAPTMTVLDGLDTVNQASYTFSRYILGPFQPTTLSADSSDEEREEAMRAAYRHVFGNAYVMEEERAELAVAESQFKLGALTAKEFVRALAKSSAYRTRFFEGASQYRFVELNFMHLLGRAPDSQAEVAAHMAVYHSSGYDAEIDSYIDSAEYDSVFGDYNLPFLRFRGAYTPCESFNKQCALKGGWANSDKAMGGAALSGYNGADGRQMSTSISSYIMGEPTPYDKVAEDSPLVTTSPNWLAFPDPALPTPPAYTTQAELRAAVSRVDTLQELYDAEIATRATKNRDALAPFRGMVSDMAPILERGFTFGDPALINPDARLPEDESALADGGCKVSDYKRYASAMETDTLSRLERDLEEAKAQLRAVQKAVMASSPVSPAIDLASVTQQGAIASVEIKQTTSRPRVSLSARAVTAPATTDDAAVEEPKSLKVGPISVPVPKLSVPSISVPKLPVPSLKNPFSK